MAARPSSPASVEASSVSSYTVDDGSVVLSPLAAHKSLSARLSNLSVSAGQDSPTMRHRLFLAELRPVLINPTTSDATRDNYALAVKNLRSGNVPSACAALNSLAASLKEEGKLDVAIAVLTESLDLRRSDLGDQHLTVALAMQSLASVHSEAGHVDEANRLFTQATAMVQAVVGREHLQMATVLNAHAQALMAQGSFVAACVAFNEAIAIRKKALGPDTAAVAATLLQYSHCVKRMGDAKRAATLGGEALAIYNTVLGPAHPTTEAARRESVFAHHA